MSDLHLLTGAYALDALDDVERAGFERHLRTCVTCALEVAEFQEAAAGLADRVALAPPDDLKGRVMAEVAITRQVSPSGWRRLPRPSLRRTFAVAAAAVLVAASAGLGGVAWQGHRAGAAAQAEASQIARVMTDPARQEVVGKLSIGGTATVVAAGDEAVFATDEIPAAPPGKTYQVWLIDTKGARSEGLLKLKDGSGQSVVSGVSKGARVAVTLEPAGGSKQPTTTPVLNLEVT